MANRKLDKLLAKAARAYEKGDRRAGSRFLNEILQVDFHHEGAWKMLHRIYGGERPFKDFQRSFAGKYYPDKAHLLAAEAQGYSGLLTESEPTVEKRSLFGRLFGWLRRKRVPAEAPSEADSTEPAQKAQAPTSSPPSTPLKRVPIQPIPQDKGTDPSPPPAAPPAAAPPAQEPAASQSLYSRPRPPLTSAVVKDPDSGNIRVMVVDDIAETRENVIRALRFEEGIDVVAVATNGTQAIQLAREHDPDVILMDVNMPDMDGITATSIIHRENSIAQIVILTVQDDTDYMRQAMMAGARDFLTKPPMIDELVTAVENANKYAQQEREKAPLMTTVAPQAPTGPKKGRIITVYSPRGGAGCSLLAANLAANLHAEDSPVVVVDGALQFGDIPVMFNIQPQINLLDLTSRADALDVDLVARWSVI